MNKTLILFILSLILVIIQGVLFNVLGTIIIIFIVIIGFKIFVDKGYKNYIRDIKNFLLNDDNFVSVMIIFYFIFGVYATDNMSKENIIVTAVGYLIMSFCLLIFIDDKKLKEAKIEESIEPSKKKNISQKVPVDISNNKYLKQALEDQERGEMTRELLEYTEKEIEDEKAMIDGMRQDYKEGKYNEVLDFNQMYMGSIHTSNIVEYLGVVASSMLQIGNEKGFKGYVAGMITMINPQKYSLEKTRNFDGLTPKVNKRLNIAIGILEQYNIDYNFSRKGFLKTLTKEELDKSLRGVTQMFLLP